jgi:hypothetical protein
MWIEYERMRFRTPVHGFDFRDAALVGDLPSFLEPELCRVGAVGHYNSNTIMACSQKNCIDPHAILISENQ